jgi:microcystin-dependent protein
MSQPFLGQIQAFGFNFAPRGWAFCNGDILSIQQNTALFSLLGTTYGGNGQTTFALPDLRGRVPVHFGQLPGGSSYALGEQAGVESVTLALNNLAAHSHSFLGTTASADSKQPLSGSAYARTTTAGGVSPGDSFYAPAGSPTAINSSTLGVTGGGLAHNNVQPTLTINWCICVAGIFPSRN